MFLVYILKCDNLTYVGMTNNFFHRWQQHNGILSGGARYTKQIFKCFQFRKINLFYNI